MLRLSPHKQRSCLLDNTRRYINCPDPRESAARRERVNSSEEAGRMEEAARLIIESAKRNAALFYQANSAPVALTEPVQPKKRGRPPKKKQASSPMPGASSKRRLVCQLLTNGTPTQAATKKKGTSAKYQKQARGETSGEGSSPWITSMISNTLDKLMMTELSPSSQLIRIAQTNSSSEMKARHKTSIQPKPTEKCFRQTWEVQIPRSPVP